MSAGQLTEKHFSDLFDAFNRHDIDAIMAFFADDCVFFTIGGDEVYGTRLEGKDAIAKAFSGVWAAMPDVRWDGHRHFVSGDRAVSEWTFRGTDANGARVEAEGCDLFTQRGGKIVRKQAFRKNRPLLKA
ncbi:MULTISPECIES: nuclear transport factor 2 family protein [unclassified Ochrobactrum]|uniref:nuclear transport factor 2 family protein n=1 Tax=unclassified Ochrobactrum TaxID=239106 RepID=UPI000DD6B82C|nr:MULTISPECIES: nuclear transport factor 2 family protein [unclassified Ochrobactrum]MBQ0707293.1 nuclear transport factor 2 family protein [Ochrobactrum sp. AP1BH01-1]